MKPVAPRIVYDRFALRVDDVVRLGRPNPAHDEEHRRAEKIIPIGTPSSPANRLLRSSFDCLAERRSYVLNIFVCELA
jgi:hypothetical protein